MLQTIKDCKDPMGAAIHDYYHTGKAEVLRVFSSEFEEDEIPVEDLFREYEWFSVSNVPFNFNIIQIY